MFKTTRRIDDSRFILDDIQHALELTEFHDVKLYIDGTQFTANRCILYGRCAFWRNSINDATHSAFCYNNVDPETFRTLLQYIYSGKIVLPTDWTVVFALLVAAEKFNMMRLFQELLQVMQSKCFNHETVFSVFEAARSKQIALLAEACLNFLDRCSLNIYESTRLWNLPLGLIKEIIDRSTFYAPEEALLNYVLDWLSRHPDVAPTVLLNCIRFKLIDKRQLSIAESYFGISSSALGSNDKYRECHVRDKNLIKALRPRIHRVVLCSEDGSKTERLEFDQKTQTLKFNSEDTVEDLSNKYCRFEMVIEFPVICDINSCNLLLQNEGMPYLTGEFAFLIRASVDGLNWWTIIDKHDDCGQGWQVLYFTPVSIKFLKIVGKDWTPDGEKHFFWSWILYLKQTFTCGKMQCLYNTSSYKTYPYKPPSNIANYQRGIAVYVDGVKTMYHSVFEEEQSVGGVSRTIAVRKYLDIALSQTFLLDSIGFHIAGDTDEQFHYRVYIWENHQEIYFDLKSDEFHKKHPPQSERWRCIAHRVGGQGWQRITFPMQRVAVIAVENVEIVSNKAKDALELLSFEAPMSQTDK